VAKTSTDTDGVFRVSLSGESAFSTDMLDFSVHSGFKYLQMEEDLVGIESYTVPSSLSAQTYNILTVTHGLGYAPLSQTFMEDVDEVTGTQFANLPYAEDSGFAGNYFIAYTNSTQFKIDMVIDFTLSAWRDHDFNFKYHIYINT
jgi:hypothetical protein